jgi:tetratricopeptide (TPR) repeat protein
VLLFAKLLLSVVLTGQQTTSAPDLSAAHRAEQAGDFAVAETIYVQLVSHRPDAELYQRLGLVRHMQNKFSSAVEAFEQAVKLDASLWSSHLFLGIDLYRINQFDAADGHLAIANRLHPGEPEIMFWSGATKLARRDFMAGFKTLEAVLERDPSNSEVLRLLAESYASFGTSLLNEVGEKYPNSPAGLIVQGKAFEFEGAYSQALDSYRAALTLAPGCPGLRESIERVEARLRDNSGSRH